MFFNKTPISMMKMHQAFIILKIRPYENDRLNRLKVLVSKISVTEAAVKLSIKFVT